MKTLTPEFRNSLDKIIREELSFLSKKGRSIFLTEISNYIQNLCPIHPAHSDRYKCEFCEEDCKYK